MISPRQRFGILLPDLAKLTLDLSTLSANDVCIGNRKKRSILKMVALLRTCGAAGRMLADRDSRLHSLHGGKFDDHGTVTAGG